jgi:hypothetical protein
MITNPFKIYGWVGFALKVEKSDDFRSRYNTLGAELIL